MPSMRRIDHFLRLPTGLLLAADSNELLTAKRPLILSRDTGSFPDKSFYRRPADHKDDASPGHHHGNGSASDNRQRHDDDRHDRPHQRVPEGPQTVRARRGALGRDVERQFPPEHYLKQAPRVYRR